jgi:hypothetical protein
MNNGEESNNKENEILNLNRRPENGGKYKK